MWFFFLYKYVVSEIDIFKEQTDTHKIVNTFKYHKWVLL